MSHARSSAPQRGADPEWSASDDRLCIADAVGAILRRRRSEFQVDAETVRKWRDRFVAGRRGRVVVSVVAAAPFTQQERPRGDAAR